MKPQVLIRNWSIVDDPWTGKRIRGRVYGHPRFTDGTMVWTSTILHMDELNGTIETRNTIYKLDDQPS